MFASRQCDDSTQPPLSISRKEPFLEPPIVALEFRRLFRPGAVVLHGSPKSVEVESNLDRRLHPDPFVAHNRRAINPLLDRLSGGRRQKRMTVEQTHQLDTPVFANYGAEANATLNVRDEGFGRVIRVDSMDQLPFRHLRYPEQLITRQSRN